jgi:predicted metal-binding membrane protein
MEAASVARPLPADLRRLLWFRPEWPWALLAAGAWLLLLLTGDLPWQVHHVGHDSTSLTHWATMAMAMMLPATLPMLRAIAQTSLWQRRYRAPAIFLLGYLLVWVALGWGAIGVWSLLGPRLSLEPTSASAVVLLLGAAWQLTVWDARFVKGTHRELSLPPHGWAADISAARFGVYHAGQCVGCCWLLMLSMVPGHGWGLMVGATAISSWQRLALRPRLHWCAAAVLALAVYTFFVGV